VRWLVRIGIVLLVLLAMLTGAGWWVLRTDGGRAWLTATALDAINSGGAVTVRLGALEGDLPFSLRLRDLEVTDSEGPWLNAERLGLAWDPWGLLGGRLHVTEISATALSVERAPVFPPSDVPEDPEIDDSGGGLGFDPRMLGLLRVDGIALNGVYLGEALVGQPVLLDVSGRVAGEGGPSNPEAIVARLDARRIDGSPAEVTLDLRLHGPDLDRIAVDLNANEGQGGMVTTLAGLPGAAGWTVAVNGNGPLDDWQGTLNAGADDLVSLSGTLGLGMADPAAPSVTLALLATPGAAAPPSWRAVLTDRLDVALSAAMGEDGTITLDTLRLATQALTVTGSGTADQSAGALSARVDGALLRADLLEPLAPLPLDSGALALTAEGALMAPVITATVTAKGLDAGVGADSLTLTATATPDGPLDGPSPTVAFDLTARAETLTGPDAVTGLLPRPLDLTGHGAFALADQRVTLDALRLSDDGGVALEADAVAALSPALDVTAQARLTMETLARLSPVLGGLSPTGSGVVTLSGVTVNADTVVSGDVRLALTDAALGIAQADAALGPAPVMTARVIFDPAAGLSVEGLDLTGEALALAGTAAIPADFSTLDAALTATLADLGRVAGDGLGGPLTLDATLSGPLGDPNLTATARMEVATLTGQAWDNIKLDASAEGLARGPSGTLSLTGNGPGGALDLKTDFALPAYARGEISGLDLTVPGTRLTGQTAIDFATTLMDGDLTLAVTDPGALAGWGAPPLSGSLTADVALTPAPNGTQGVTLTAKAPSLALADAGVSLGALDVRAVLSDALGTPTLDSTVTSQGGDAGGLTWERLTASAKGPLVDLAVTAGMTGTGPTGPLSFDGAARVQPPGLAETGQVIVQRLDLETGGHAVALRQPATLALDGGARVDRLVLSLDDGALTLAGGLTGEDMDVSVTGEGLPLTLADLAAPDMVGGGRLDLSATLKGRLPTPKGTLSLTASGVTLDTANLDSGQRDSGQNVPPLNADISGRLEQGRLTAEASVTGFADKPARLTADIPLRLGGGAAVPEGEPLSVSAQWDGPVGAIWEMLPMVVEHRLSGALALDATVSGTLAAPRVNADVRLTNGRYEHLTAGTLIDDLTLTARAEGTERITVSLSGHDSGAGRLTGEGDISLTPDGPVGSVTTALNTFVVVRRDDVTASADANLAVALEGDHGAVSGQIRTREVRVRLDAIAGSGSVTTLDVVEINDAGSSGMDGLNRAAAEADAAAEAGETEPESAFPIALDIGVDMPNRVYVAGQGLDSEWQGKLHVGGTAALPRVTGLISVRRGTFEAVGKQFAIETGTVQFTGGRRINPLLEVIALYETEDIEARVGLRGPVDDPVLVLESVPPLPTDEVLAQILFSKSSGELTTLETVQLARALASLTGMTGGGPDIMDIVRSTMGLDVLRVGGDVASGGAALEAGQYLGDDVYVGVEQGLEPGSGGVTVEVDLGSGFKVESKAGRTGEGEVGLMWRKDY